MTDTEMYELLLAKSQDIKMHMDAADVAGIAERFKALSEKQIPKRPTEQPLQVNEMFWLGYIGCPVCGYGEVTGYDGTQQYKYCPDCGQRLLWEGEK